MKAIEAKVVVLGTQGKRETDLTIIYFSTMIAQYYQVITI